MTRLEQLFDAIAREEDALRARSRGRERIRAELALLDPMLVKAQRTRRRVGVLLSAASVTALAAGVALYFNSARETALSVTLGPSGDKASVGAWIGASESKTLPLNFSDGTQIEMAPGTRARLVELDAHGAHLRIENGKANVRVVHQPAASWRLTMGPFAVRVTGTRFDVRWDAEKDVFELALQEGQVTLSGCVFGNGKPLTAGQTVRASCKNNEVEIGYLARATSPEVSSPNANSPSAAPADTAQESIPEVEGELLPAEPNASAPAKVARRANASERDPEFRELAHQGKYVEAFKAAERAGFENVCAKASADDLSILADSARYAGNTRQAVYAWKLARSRFPGSKAAALAAFAMGRLEFDSRGSYSKAAQWFRTYLSEQPNGPLSREARGRLMEALNRSGDTAGARQLAEQYLKAYPSGPHAALARRIQASNP